MTERSRNKQIIAIVSFLVLYLASTAMACPLIDGLVNYNCDKIIKIAFVGDSIVSGVGDSKNGNKGGYVKRLKSAFPNAKITNDGVPGVTTGRLIRYLKTEFRSKRRSRYYRRAFGADLIIVDVGRNDYWSESASAAITARNIRRIAKILKRKRVRKFGVASHVVVATLLPTNRSFQAPFITGVNENLRRLDSEAMPLSLDFFSMPPYLLASDGLHPTSEGYHWLKDLMARFIRGELQSLMANRRADGDSDGVYDIFEEKRFGTDPENPDSDNDTFTDGEELFQLQTDPLDPLDPEVEDSGAEESGEGEGEAGEGDSDGEAGGEGDAPGGDGDL